MRKPARTFAVLGLAAMVAGCGGNDPLLMNVRNSERGPDEFAILPTKPLEDPASFTDLPPPTPGGSNRTDPTPQGDAVAALGGRPALLEEDGRLTGGAIVTHASRFGVTPNIRAALAAEDLEYRRRNEGLLLERLFNVNVYFRAYRGQSLDKYAELERFRRLGVFTPAAPPQSSAEE